MLKYNLHACAIAVQHIRVGITALNTEACSCKYCIIYLPLAPVDPDEPVDPVTALPGGPRPPEGPVAPCAPVSPGGPGIAISHIPPTPNSSIYDNTPFRYALSLGTV